MYIWLIRKIIQFNLYSVFLLTGITNTVGRIISGGLGGVSCVNSLMLNNVSMLIAGVAIMLTPFCNTYTLLVVVASVFGLFTGKINMLSL